MAPWARRLGCVFGVLCANQTREVKRDFCDLPMRRNEGRVVNTPLVFKRVLFHERKKKKRSGEEDEETRERERTKGRERRTRRPERENRKEVGRGGRVESGRENGRKESGIGVKKTMNAGGVENGL
ncbi:hypothetical protein TNCV_5077461 [Trichonephila clavipes]|uniref:Uncharacterized protein n=1 Tax=Trichonephila clavipes TaxID=2585209 RepID=A0A8X6V6M9_TRICX|nr:hypothetical protein TNCV_5077461 [Trichonephila clavipes]